MPFADGSPPRIGYLSEVDEGLVHLPESRGAHVLGPLCKDPLHLGVRRCDHDVGAGREPHQPGTAVGGVGHPVDVPGRLKLLDQEGGGLLGDSGLLGEVGDSVPCCPIRAAMRACAGVMSVMPAATTASYARCSRAR